VNRPCIIPKHASGDITLDSARVRTAAALAEQVKAGVHLAEALGREIERRVGEPGLVQALRTKFPPRPEWSGRRVCDGQQVLDAAVLPTGIDRAEFDDLGHTLDTYADLLVTDAVHSVVEERAIAAADTASASDLSSPRARMLGLTGSCLLARMLLLLINRKRRKEHAAVRLLHGGCRNIWRGAIWGDDRLGSARPWSRCG
jgi:hypothetical protein